VSNKGTIRILFSWLVSSRLFLRHVFGFNI
jgi:hypothetical protein